MTCGRTDPGVRRENNEDAFRVVDRLGLYLVADGLGGLPDGEVASELAVETAAQAIERAITATRHAPRDAMLEAAVRQANARLLAHYRHGMATTLTAMLLERATVHVAHVGDCRVYRWRPGQGLRRLTRDHSRVQALVDRGLITEAGAAHHPWSHQLERALGLEADITVDLRSEPRRADDRFLLCSDGLIRVLSEPEIEALLASPRSSEEQANALVERARAGGAPDNVTVIVVHG